MHINPTVIYIVSALFVVTLVAVIGAIASNMLKFNYSYLAPLSLVIYILLGYLVSQEAGLGSTLLSSSLVGFFDSTVGWQLCIYFNANLGKYQQESLERPATTKVTFVVLFSVVLGLVGYLIANS